MKAVLAVGSDLTIGPAIPQQAIERPEVIWYVPLVGPLWADDD